MRARGAQASAALETGVVAALSEHGEGIVHEGKIAFVPGALPGETIRFRRTRRHRQYDEARLEEILSRSAKRVSPRCAHFEICGGCALQHLEHAEQLRLKQQQLCETLERLAHLALKDLELDCAHRVQRLDGRSESGRHDHERSADCVRPQSRQFIDAFRASNTFYVVTLPINRQPETAFTSTARSPTP